MNQCTREDARHYLAGLLSEADTSTFIAHLEDCPWCRQRLEKEAGDEQAWLLTRELLGGSPDPESWSQPKTDHASEPVACQAAGLLSELTFLAPSDDPAMLGRLGVYEVIGMLGRGGMGIVLKGFDRALHRNVAIKVLDPVLANVGAARQRFAREARAMAAISHEHVVPVYGVDEHGRLPYFVMEYVPGGTLERRLTQEGPCKVVEVVRVGLQVAQALAAAHRQGLIHRDIKPSNVLLDQGTERVRVADFGLARAANDASFTRTGLLAGTPQYMAPEQIRGESCDAQSDLFSLGSLMYSLCAGHPPFRSESVYAVMQRIVHDEPRSLREQNPEVPAWLEDLIFKLLAKEKLQRFATADDVIEALEMELAYLQNPQIGIEPSRTWRGRSTSRGMARQTRMRLRLAIAGSLVTVGALAVGWLIYDRSPDLGHGDGNYDVNASSAASPTAPLWDVDGLRETRAAATALEAEWHRTPIESQADPWPEKTKRLRQRMAALSADAQEPWAADQP
ncbi:MAG: protein kinase [Pirellulales bacterium]